MKMKNLYFLLIFLFLFQFISSSVQINYSDGVTIDGIDINIKEEYEVTIKDTSPSYIHITVISKDTTDSENLGNNEILSFSSTDPECMTGREQLAQSFRGAPEMWIKKEQYSNKVFYLVVQCPDSTTRCNYQLKMESAEYVLLNRNAQISYYTNKKNEVMIFHIPKRDLDPSILHNGYAEIWFKGAENIQMMLEYYKGTEVKIITSQKHYLNGAIFSFKEDIYEYPEDDYTDAYYKLTIDAKDGDYITVGNKAIDDKGYVTDKNILFPNTGETTGYLKKGNLEKECFYLVKPNIAKDEDYFFISGNFYNKYFMISYYKEDGTKYQEQQITKINYAKKFSYKDITNGDINSFCIELSTSTKYTNEEALFTFEILDHVNKNNYRTIYSPQLAGRRYNRLMESGSIAIFSVFGTEFERFFHYNARIISGIPRMFFHQCKTYPLCDYTENELINLKDNIKGPHYVDKIYSYTFDDTSYKESPISSTQNLIIIECFKDTSGNEINSDETDFCNFETFVTDDTQQIILDEGEHFYRHIHELEVDKYLVNLDGYNSAYKVFIDLQVISGDIFLDINAPSPYTYTKYEVSNKIFYSIHVNKEQGPFSEITFQVDAKNNSYYLVSYLVIKDATEESLHSLESGMNYLEACDKTLGKQTTIYFTNNQKYKKFPFFVSFYSLNCQFDIKRNTGKNLEVTDSYAQEIVSPDESYYSSEQYIYELTILSIDSSRYEGDFCFFYASGLELDSTTESDTKGIGRHIVISENIPQRAVFQNGINNIKFLFPHSSPDKNINVNFNLIDLANYDVKIYYEYKVPSSTNVISRTQHLFLEKDEPDWRNGCTYSNNLCNIIIDITLKTTVFDENPMLEISVKPIPAFPTYVTKSLMRSDYLSGDQWLYLYTDLSLSDEGDVVFNFLKGSGEFYARIVPKNTTIPDEGAEWRGLFRFPKSEEESITINSYLKKLIFDQENTNKCVRGCYLLVSVRSNMITDIKEEYRPVPFTVIIHSRNNNNIPLIQINTDEYVIGNVDNNYNNDIYEFYSLILSNDGEEVNIDWQSDAACIYIQIGEQRPSIKNYHFYYCSPGFDSVYTIKKDDILNKYGDSSRDTLKDLKMIIGTYSKRLDSVYTTVYSMKVILRKPVINIYPVNSNQKVLCPTENSSDGKNSCLFLVLYEDLDILQHLVIYPKSQTNNAKLLIHADYIPFSKYEQWDTSYLTNNIPNEKSTYTNSLTGKDFLYIPNGDYESHLYVAVYSDQPTTIELVTTFSGFDEGFAPNPSTIQVISFKKEFFTLKFDTYNDIAVSLVSLQGKSRIYWEFDKENENEYYLGGREDRLSIVLTSDMCEQKNCNLIINNLEPDPDETNPEEPGFTFLISYTLRASGLPGLIFEELIYGKSTEIVYRNSKFPIILYCQLPDKESSANIYFDFREMKSDKERNTIYDSSIDVNAMILTTDDIFKFKADPTYIKIDPNTVKGVFSSAINVGNAYLTEEDMKKFEKVTDIPWLFIYLTKTSDIPDLFTKMTLEAAVAKANNDVYTSQSIYQYGKLGIDEKNIYKLKGDTDKKYLRIQFSSNSGIINYSIRRQKDNDYRKNDTSINIVKNEWINGRGLLTMYLENGEDIYLTVFNSDINSISKGDETYLTNYVFKYVCVAKMEDYKEYRVEDDLIKYNKNNNTLTFNKIKDVQDPKNVIYFVKLIKKDNYLEKENINTIAITQSSGQSYGYENLVSNNDQLVVELKDISLKTVYYYNIIAQINEERIAEYISYRSEGTINIDDKGKDDDKEEPNKTVVIVLIVMVIIFILIITILLVCLFRVKKERNTLLMDRVKETSFKSQGYIEKD